VNQLLKLLVFLTILLIILIAAVKVYRTFNQRILASTTLSGVIGNALLMVLINAALCFGGSWILFTVYGFLKSANQ
jgi:hypothetical protein